SFSDIYGFRRFHSVAASKLLALELAKPLVLLPQTYGPYCSERAQNIARRIIAGASEVWARDEQSGLVVDELLNGRRECRIGVDMAFGLPVSVPRHSELVDVVTAFRRSTDLLV